MRVFITNDDGIFADGLTVLLKELKSIASHIYVVAPDRERSATGHSITMHRPLRVRVADFPDNKVQGWIVDGTPADCVKLGLESLIPDTPDIVIAGINYGPNLGTDVLYSGTVASAAEGVINGIPSVAISLATHGNPDYRYAANFVKKLVPVILDHGLPCGTLLNINIPSGKPAGYQITKLGNLYYRNAIDKRTDPRGRDYFWMAGKPYSQDYGDPLTDIGTVKNGLISITPVQLDMTNYKLIPTLKKWKLDLE
ncbi:MAG: 5'/3'-nucleotidase SurE [Peptococcaceae bacterium]|nr:5'/3'-nucleotidase SurE [Peptococcaceae bacterium]